MLTLPFSIYIIVNVLFELLTDYINIYSLLKHTGTASYNKHYFTITTIVLYSTIVCKVNVNVLLYIYIGLTCVDKQDIITS